MRIINEPSSRTYKNIGKCFYCISIFFVLLALILGSINVVISDILFCVFWVALFWGTIIFFLIRKTITYTFALQCFSGSTIICAFWLATLRESIVYHADFNKCVAIIGSITLIFMVINYLLTLYYHKNELRKIITNYIKKNSYVFIVIIIYFVLYLNCFTFLFKADSYTYYSTLAANEGYWTFSLSDIQKFQIGYHSTYGYSLFAFLGNYILRIYGLGIRLINFLLTTTAIVCMNNIFQHIFQDKKKSFYFLLLITFIFNPLILGIGQEISTDMPMTCFLVWFIWAFLNHYKVYVVLFACLVCFTKENAIILLFGYVASIYVVRLVKEYFRFGFSFRKIFTVLKVYEWAILLAPILYLINMYFYNSWNNGNTVITSGKNMLNSFQLNFEYITIKLSQMFIFNFQWLILIIVIVGLIVILFSRKKIGFNETNIGIIGSFVFYTGFQLLYFTYPHYRYLIPSAFYYTIFLGMVLQHFSRCATCEIILTSLSLLLAIQSFYSIDFISNCFFRTVSTGNGSIISLAYYTADNELQDYLLLETEGGDLSNEVFRDYVQNNRQYEGFEQCFEKMMSSINYSEDKGLILSPIYDSSYWGADQWTFNNLFGTTDRHVIHWSEKWHQLTYEETDVVIQWIDSDMIPYNKDSNYDYDEIWYIEFPYDTNFNFKNYRDNFKILEKKVIIHGQWQINAYRIEIP